MKKITESFKDKKFKYGGYAALATAMVIIIVIVINLLVNQIPWVYDASDNQMYSISQESTEIIKSVDIPISIIGLFEVGSENETFSVIIDKYASMSKNITYTTIDPVRNPAFSTQYAQEGETLSQGTYIIAGDNGRYKVINSDDVFNYAYDSYGQVQLNSLSLEQHLTSAIKYVMVDSQPIVYTLAGHGEEQLQTTLLRDMELENYLVKELLLLESGKVPDDCNVLVINAPTVDLQTDELDAINEYFNNYGSALFMMGLVDEVMPNFTSLLGYYGVAVHHDSFVIEGNASNYYQNPTLLVPNLMPHPITDTLIEQRLRLTALGSQYIRELDLVRDEIVIESLLVTSDRSWAKSDLDNVDTMEAEQGDAIGPFSIATAITDNKLWDAKEAKFYSAKIIIIANTEFLKPEAYASEPNFDFVINGMNWLLGEEDGIYIRPKNLSTMPLQMSAKEVYFYASVTVIVIPLVVLIIGLVVWRKRRHL